MSQLQIIADRSRCIGAGQCVLAATALFTQDEEDGLVVLKAQTVSFESRGEAEFAVASCPTQALSLKPLDMIEPRPPSRAR